MSSIDPNEPIYVLSISANDQDHDSLVNVFGSFRWRIVAVSNLDAASVELKRRNVSVVVYDCDSTPEDWKNILDRIRRLPVVPPVILTSRIADDHLWTQALDLGVWDVLPKPLRTAEVVRSVRYAWEHWRNQDRVRPIPKAMIAAG